MRSGGPSGPDQARLEAGAGPSEERAAKRSDPEGGGPSKKEL